MRAQIQVLPQRFDIFETNFSSTPREGERICINYGKQNESTFIVEEVIHVGNHDNSECPDIILKVSK